VADICDTVDCGILGEIEGIEGSSANGSFDKGVGKVAVTASDSTGGYFISDRGKHSRGGTEKWSEKVKKRHLLSYSNSKFLARKCLQVF
jgi:hypothetical protein